MNEIFNNEFLPDGSLTTLFKNDPVNAEIFFNEFLDTASDCYWIIDSQYNIIDISDYAENLTGYSKSELIRKNFLDLFPVQMQGRVRESFEKIKNTKKFFFEAEITRKDGFSRFVEINSKFLPHFNNCIIGFVSDITSKKIERDTYLRLLQDEERKLKAFFDNAIDMIIITDHNAKIIEVNDLFVSTTGKSREELLTLNIFDLINLKIELDDLNLNQTLSYECELIKNNRTSIPIQLNIKKFIYGDNFYFFFSGIDITDKKEIIFSLHKLEKNYQDLFNKMLDGFALHRIILDDNGTPCDYVFLDINPSFEKLTGLKKEDLIGKRVLEVLPHTEKYWIDTYGDVALNDKVIQIENYSVELDKYFKVTAYSPEKYLFATIIEDVTANRKYSKELQKINQDLEKSIKMKDKFLSIIAHDIRNPFHSIMGFADLLINNNQKYTEDKKLRMLKTISETSEAGSKLLENLLLWARFQKGSIQPNPQILKLYPIIKELVELNKPQLILKNISVFADIEESIFVFADKDMLNVVLRNIFSNAIKFSPPNSKIEIYVTENDDKITLEIRDYGYGMSEDDLNNLFRLDIKNSEMGKHIENKEKGSGLGLILCKDFIEANNGSLVIDSQINSGTSFFVTLPKFGKII